MKVNNFDALVVEVAEFFIRYDVFGTDTDSNLYLLIDGKGNGHLIINPSITEGLEYLQTYRPGEIQSDFSEVERDLGMAWEDTPVAVRYEYFHTGNNAQAYFDCAEYFLEASMVENPYVDYSWYNPE